MPAGKIIGLHRTPSRRATPEPVGAVTIREDWGVVGDHHARAGRSRQVVITEGEVLDALDLKPGETREQVTIAGAGPLAAGVVLEVGTVRLELVTPRVPCRVMDEIRPGLERELRGRGGWCARVLAGGDVRIGDSVRSRLRDDPAWIVGYLAASAEWEAVPPESRTFEPGWGFPQQFAHLIAWDERGATRIEALASGIPHEHWGPEDIEAFNAAAVARLEGADLWALHDQWSTEVVAAARRHPEHGEAWLRALAAHYREHC